MFLDGPRPGGLAAATNGGAGCGAQAATPRSNIGERNRRFIGFSHAIRNRLDLARVPLFLMLPTRALTGQHVISSAEDGYRGVVTVTAKGKNRRG